MQLEAAPRVGYDIMLDCSLRFEYTTRSSWRALYRQYRHYGSVRVRVVMLHPDYLRPRHVVPAGFVAALATLAALSPSSTLARTVLAGALPRTRRRSRSPAWLRRVTQPAR